MKTLNQNQTNMIKMAATGFQTMAAALMFPESKGIKTIDQAEAFFKSKGMPLPSDFMSNEESCMSERLATAYMIAVAKNTLPMLEKFFLEKSNEGK